MLRALLPAALVSLVCATLGCDGTGAEGTGSMPDGGSGGVLPTGTEYRVVRGRGAMAGQPVPVAEMLGAATGARAVCLGETHNDDAHHEVQQLVVDQMARAPMGRRQALGMEMFQRRVQPVLDQFQSGAIDEAAMLQQAGWALWGYDYAFYKPVVDRAVAADLRLLALNANRDLVMAVSRGGLASLTPQQQAELPEMDLGDAQHKEWFKQTVGSVGHDPARLDAIYVVQVLWDETMAETTAKWLASDAAPARAAILAGWGHCMDLAIPARLRRRGVTPTVSLRTVDEAEVNATVAQGFFDYLVVLRR